MPRPGERTDVSVGGNLEIIPMNLSSSKTAYSLTYWAMVTNTTLFYNSNIHSKRASYKYLARGTSGGNSETKLAMSNNQGYRPFGRVFSVEICNNGKAFPSIRVEDLNYFRDIATEILIGLFDASLHQYLFLYRGFHQI